MFRWRWYLATMAILCSGTWCAGEVTASGPGHIPLYETFELVLEAPGATAAEPQTNPFTRFAELSFVQGDRTFKVDGFFDGQDLWRARFMPDAVGSWSYTWSFAGQTGHGTFECLPRTNPLNHGHVRMDPHHPQGLLHDDGTIFYAWGGKWFAGKNYGPAVKNGVTNGARLSDDQILAYLDQMVEFRHNASLLKIALHPLENDQISWDLDWLRRGEWVVREMARRGIYCQLTCFCTWGRSKNHPFGYSTQGTQQVFNVWTDSDMEAKENYLRTIVARFSGFYNAYWELGNEIISTIRKPGDPLAFRDLSNKYYLPWIRQYDPYRLPIGCSYVNRKEIVRTFEVDLNFPHTDGEVLIFAPFRKPMIQNEPCNDDSDALDRKIRDPKNTSAYRRTFWHTFAAGGNGAYQASWLDITVPLSEPVLEVMRFQRSFREFVEALPVCINEMIPLDGFVVGPSATAALTRAKPGTCYITYWPPAEVPEGELAFRLPVGDYRVQWYDPAQARFLDETLRSVVAEPLVIHHPAWTEDRVLLITRCAEAP